MAQIFHRSTNFIARFTLFSAIFLAGLGLTAILGLARSPYATNQNVSRAQPVQFSHKHHAGDDGIDCRYCHTGVETSAVAGIPPTKTCMNCHSVLFADSAYLEPIRESYRTGESIQWVKVHRLPDYVYFNHQMPLMFQASPLLMEWCIDCHRHPEKVLRPLEPVNEVFNMDWKPSGNQEEMGKKFVADRKIRSAAELTSCSTCHR